MPVMVPSRWMMNFITTRPAAPWFLFQFSMIRWFIAAMYSGQQKSPTLIWTPPPPPPPVLRPPNGIGAAPVSARASPRFTSAPDVGVRLDDLSAALSTFGAGFGLADSFGSGMAISGGFAAGGVSTRFGSGGATVWTERPDSCVIPPAFGPTEPPSEISIGVIFSLVSDERQLEGMNKMAVRNAACAAHDTTTMRDRPSLWRTRRSRMSLTASCIFRRSASSAFARLRHHRHLVHAGLFQLVGDIEQILQGRRAVAADVDRLVVTPENHLAQP